MHVDVACCFALHVDVLINHVSCDALTDFYFRLG